MAEQEESNASHDKSSAVLSKGDRARLKLKLFARYALLGITPVVAVAALVLAVMAASNNKSGQEQFNQTQAKIDSLNTSLSATKGELEMLKVKVEKEKASRSEELAKLDERVKVIVQNITPMQVKLKISPTLDQQLNQPADVVAPAPVTPHAAAPVAAPHVAAPAAKPHVVAPALPATPHPATASAAPPKSTVSTGADKKLSPQVKAMKDAIEQYNKK